MKPQLFSKDILPFSKEIIKKQIKKAVIKRLADRIVSSWEWISRNSALIQ